MQTTQLGNTTLEVSRLAMDCRGIGTRERDRGWDPLDYDCRVFAIRTIHAALDAGINLFDSSPDADNGRGETLLGKALMGRRENVLLSSKLGCVEDKDALESRILATLRRLRADHLDIVYVDDQLGQRDCLLAPLSRLRERGVVRFLGLEVLDRQRAEPLISSGVFDIATFEEEMIDDPDMLFLVQQCVNNGMGTGIATAFGAGRRRRGHGEAPAEEQPQDAGASAVERLSTACFDFLSLGLRWEHEVITSSRMVADLKPAFAPLVRAH